MQTKKAVIFLDFDGVLVLNKEGAEPGAVAVVNRIVEKTGADIVVSSAWRHYLTVPQLRILLAEWGVRANVVAKTPAVGDRHVAREEEIKAYIQLNRKQMGPYVILDDMYVGETLKPVHVQTDTKEGLKTEHGEMAIEILGENRHDA